MRQRFCIKCGEKIIEGALFCAYCGAKLLVPEVEEPVVTAKPVPEPIPEPEPVIEEPVYVPEPMPEPEPVIEEPVYMPEPEPEPVIEEPVYVPEPEPVVEEPVYVPEPIPEPEPMIEEPVYMPEPIPEPEPVIEEPVVAAQPAPEPVPVIVEPAAEPAPEPAEDAPEGEVYFDNIGQKVDINDDMFDMYNGLGEGTVYLVGQKGVHGGDIKEKNGIFYLSDSEMQKGVVRIVDFGTGDRFEITIPAGVRDGDNLLITDTGLMDHETGAECNIRLRVVRI